MTDTALIVAPRGDLVTPAALDPVGRWEAAAADWLLGKRSERTRATYADAWAAFLAYVNRPPWAIERAHIIGWRDDLVRQGKADATVAARLAAISSFYRFARREGLTDRNPAEGVERPRVKPYGKTAWLTEDEAARVLASIPTSSPTSKRDRALLGLALTMGLRRAELLGIRRRDVLDQGDGRPLLRYKPKGKAEETRALPAAAWRALRPYLVERGDLAADAPIFSLTPEGLRYIVRTYTRRALGKAVNPHSLRHTAASILWTRTGKLSEVQALMGHNRATTTEIYIHALQADDRARLGDVIGDALGL